MYSQKAFGERLSFLRSKAGIDFFQTRDKIGIDSSEYYRYELGRYIPQEEIIYTICEYFDVSPEWLLVGIALNDKERQLSEELEKDKAERAESLRKLGIYD